MSFPNNVNNIRINFNESLKLNSNSRGKDEIFLSAIYICALLQQWHVTKSLLLLNVINSTSFLRYVIVTMRYVLYVLCTVAVFAFYSFLSFFFSLYTFNSSRSTWCDSENWTRTLNERLKYFKVCVLVVIQRFLSRFLIEITKRESILNRTQLIPLISSKILEQN